MSPISSTTRLPSPVSVKPVLLLAEAESRRQAAETSRTAVQAVPDDMLQARRDSRKNRLSIFLPHFMSSSDAKGEQDKLQKKVLPYLPPLFQGDEPQSESPSSQLSAQEPPTRLPPVVPGARPHTPPPSSKKLQKAESPTRRLLARPSSPAASPQQIEGKKLRVASTLGPPAQSAEVNRRSVSSPVHRRTDSSGSEVGKQSKRKSWMPGLGKRSRNASSEDLNKHTAEAWIVEDGHKLEYSLVLLSSGMKVSRS
jgi:hypothetical protein